MKTYSYIRVSATDQKEFRQIDAMASLGIPKTHICIDKQSGRNFTRTAYIQLVSILKPGDLLYIESIDRLGRNYEEIQNQWHLLTKDIGVDIVVLDMPLLDTRQAKDLMGTFIADLVLQILSFLAQSELEHIKKRQAQGIAAAKARGVQFGPPRRLMPKNFGEIVAAWEQGQFSLEQAFSQCGIGKTTFFHRVREYRQTRIGEQKSPVQRSTHL